MNAKDDLRAELRRERRAHVEAQPETIRALLFKRPPAPVMDRIPDKAVIGLYRATQFEAPASGYAKFLRETGYDIALPWFEGRESPMAFRLHSDPFGETDLEKGPFKLMQPGGNAEYLTPDLLFVPLLGFTARGERLGQGAGHYDRWLDAHPDTITIGLAWDAQLRENLPTEKHDVPLDMIVTPTRIYGPF